MEIEGLCRLCGSTFDAHFTIMPIGKEKCPACGATGHKNIAITTDEDDDHRQATYEAKHRGNDNDNN